MRFNLNHKKLEYSRISMPIRPKFNQKTNIYSLSQKLVREKQEHNRWAKKITFSALFILLVGGYFLTN